MSRKAWIVAGTIALLLVGGFLALLGFGLNRDVQKLPSALVGQPAPAFSSETLSGDTLSSRELRGRVVILNFWASWCVPCRQEHAVLQRAERAWEEDRARVVGVVYQDTRPAARRFMERLGGDWPSLMDPESRIAIDFGVYGVPETFFLGPDGTVAKKHIGALSWDVVRSTVDSLLDAPAGDVSAAGGRDVSAAGGPGGGR